MRQELVRELRDQIGGEEGRRRAYEFVTSQFRAEADGAYMELGFPPITLASAWTVFTSVVNLLEARH